MTQNPSCAYLDHAATTPMCAEALQAMQPFFDERFANPSGAHWMARDAMRAVNDARDKVAELFGAEPGEVIFCSGATEADNLAVFGVAGASEARPPARQPVEGGAEIVCSAIEHSGVMAPVERLGGVAVGVDSKGILDLDQLSQTVGENTKLVSVMLVNNETGIIQPLAEVAEVLAERAPQAVFHTDAVQAVNWLDVAELAKSAQMISLSAHKFGGPKGVGVLIARRGVNFVPLIFGGGQERERRAGTHNVAGIAGLAAAAEVAVGQRAANVQKVSRLRDQLADFLMASIPGVLETGVSGIDLARSTGDRSQKSVGDFGQKIAGDRSHKIAGSCHLCFKGIESEALLFLLEREGVYASAASSCASGAFELSHVLAAMGISRDLAKGSLRLSLGGATTQAEVDLACRVIPPAVGQLRKAAA